MGDIYLTDAADWLRAAGLVVVEYEGWKYRAKSSGGYNDASRPWGVMLHHTAGNGDAESDSAYQCYGADAAPISNATIDRNGDVWLLAAGPTNTNGSGNGVRWSKGDVPTDSLNSYTFGVEICNNGVGGPYPEAQVSAALAVANTINAHCGNQPDDVAIHFTWAPDRKIDPSTAAAVEGPWQPRSVNSSGTWDVEDVKAECRRRAGTLPSPRPPSSGDDMAVLFVEVSDAHARFIGVGQPDPLILWQVEWSDSGRAAVHAEHLPHVSVSAAQLSGCTLVGPLPQGDGAYNWTERDFYERVPSSRG